MDLSISGREPYSWRFPSFTAKKQTTVNDLITENNSRILQVSAQKSRSLIFTNSTEEKIAYHLLRGRVDWFYRVTSVRKKRTGRGSAHPPGVDLFYFTCLQLIPPRRWAKEERAKATHRRGAGAWDPEGMNPDSSSFVDQMPERNEGKLVNVRG